MSKITFIIIAIVTVFSLSCHKSFDPGTTNAQKAASGWWVTSVPNGASAAGAKHIFINTYNTSEGGDSLWVDDVRHSVTRFRFKSKAKIDFNALTFTASNSTNLYTAANTVNITEGKILLKGGHSASGVITDSLYFKIKFSNNDTTLIVSGVARTGYIEDDY